MKGLFIPEITAEMFRSGCLESIEALMAEGEIYDIDYEPEPKKGKWQEKEVAYNGDEMGVDEFQIARCSVCEKYLTTPYSYHFTEYPYCPNCGADMRGEE